MRILMLCVVILAHAAAVARCVRVDTTSHVHAAEVVPTFAFSISHTTAPESIPEAVILKRWPTLAAIGQPCYPSLSQRIGTVNFFRGV
jgi:hypothetical protein